MALPPDAPETDHCGTCRACLDVCPTEAFPAPYRLDARRCISYLTIEHDGPIPREFRKAIGNRIYGCDDCLAVCPWNKFAQATREAKLQARAELVAPPLADLAALDEPAFRKLFSASPIKRIGRDRFVRNVLVAIGNSGALGPRAASPSRHLADPSPQVRGAAVWALPRAPAAPRNSPRRRRTIARAKPTPTSLPSGRRMSEPRFFKSQKEWRAWLEKNHANATELLVGFHKTSSTEKGITYKEALDEALCFGWIDAARRGGDATLDDPLHTAESKEHLERRQPEARSRN